MITISCFYGRESAHSNGPQFRGAATENQGASAVLLLKVEEYLLTILPTAEGGGILLATANLC